MNNGTKIRTVLVIATCFNTALMSTDFAQFHNATVDMAYRIISVILNFVIVACATWYNNDYTVEGATGTQITREMKALRGETTAFVEEPEDSYIEEDNEDPCDVYAEEVDDE